MVSAWRSTSTRRPHAPARRLATHAGRPIAPAGRPVAPARRLVTPAWRPPTSARRPQTSDRRPLPTRSHSCTPAPAHAPAHAPGHMDLLNDPQWASASCFMPLHLLPFHPGTTPGLSLLIIVRTFLVPDLDSLRFHHKICVLQLWRF